MLAAILFEIIAISLLIVAFSIPLVRESVEMNRWYGIKIPKAYKSEENWYAINKYGGKVLIVLSVVMCVVFVPLAIMCRHSRETLSLFTCVPGLYVLALIPISIYASKLP